MSVDSSYIANTNKILAILLQTATIYDDGTNKIMLKFASSSEGDSTSERGHLLGELSYAKMSLVRGSFELPATGKVTTVGEMPKFTSP